MNIYIWNNGGCDSDFAPDENISMDGICGGYSSNAHSGGIVVAADTLEEARELIAKNQNTTVDEVNKFDEYKPVILSRVKKGVILYADGAC